MAGYKPEDERAKVEKKPRKARCPGDWRNYSHQTMDLPVCIRFRVKF